MERKPPTYLSLVLVSLGLVLPTLVTWVYFLALDGAQREYQQAAFVIGKSIQFGLPLVALWLLGGRAWPKAIHARGLIAGGLFGLAVGGAMVAVYFLAFKPAGTLAPAAAAVRTKVQTLGGASLPAFVALALFYSVVHSLLEEYYWRWFAFGRLAEMCRLPLAIGVSAVAFSSHHILVLAHYFGWTTWMTWLSVASVATGGAVWAWLYWRTRSLLGPWLSHALVDAAIFFIGYDIMKG